MSEEWLCAKCPHPQHEHESPLGCARCSCDINYWGGPDDDGLCACRCDPGWPHVEADHATWRLVNRFLLRERAATRPAHRTATHDDEGTGR